MYRASLGSSCPPPTKPPRARSEMCGIMLAERFRRAAYSNDPFAQGKCRIYVKKALWGWITHPCNYKHVRKQALKQHFHVATNSDIPTTRRCTINGEGVFFWLNSSPFAVVVDDGRPGKCRPLPLDDILAAQKLNNLIRRHGLHQFLSSCVIRVRSATTRAVMYAKLGKMGYEFDGNFGVSARLPNQTRIVAIARDGQLELHSIIVRDQPSADAANGR